MIEKIVFHTQTKIENKSWIEDLEEANVEGEGRWSHWELGKRFLAALDHIVPVQAKLTNWKMSDF